MFFCGVSYFLCVLLASGAEAALGAAEQEQRALEIRLAIVRLLEDQVKEREALYREIVKSCPKTEAAEEALWALSNLYLDAFPEPQEQTAQEVLELLLARYPDSRWGLQVRSRLISFNTLNFSYKRDWFGKVLSSEKYVHLLTIQIGRAHV